MRAVLSLAILALVAVGANGQVACSNAAISTTPTTAALLFGWGMNWDSELSAQRSGANVVRSPSMLQVTSTASPKYSRVSSGLAHTAVLESTAGTGFVVGKGDDGQVGFGPLSQTEVKNFNPLGEVLENGLPEFKGDRAVLDIAAGWYHTCILLPSVAAPKRAIPYCTGKNDRGQLGTTEVQNSISLPIQVDNTTGLGDANVVKLASGPDHVLALTSDGFMYSWGEGSNGELGNGATASSRTPVLIRLRHPIQDIACGYRFCLALTSTSDLYGWGLNDAGQLGGASKDTVVNQPTKIASGVTLFAAGGAHALAVINGQLHTWGSGTMGATAQAKTIDANVQAEWTVAAPTPVASFKGVNIQSVAAGMKHSVVLDTCGNVYTFGSDAFGQLGLGQKLGLSQLYRSYTAEQVSFGGRKMKPLAVYAGAFTSFLVAQETPTAV